MISKKVFATSVISLYMTTLCSGYVQELILKRQKGDELTTISLQKSVPDVNSCLSNMTSFCVRGFWVVYDDIEFLTYSANIYGFNSSLTCFDGPFRYKSARFGGAMETSTVAISVYPAKSYEGPVQLVTGSGHGLLNGRSFLYSGGGQEEFTIYEAQNFEGRAVCTSFSGDFVDLEVYGHYDVSVTLGINQIGSVVRGCNPKERDASIALLLDQSQKKND